jgi:hypothetical protein
LEDHFRKWLIHFLAAAKNRRPSTGFGGVTKFRHRLPWPKFGRSRFELSFAAGFN